MCFGSYLSKKEIKEISIEVAAKLAVDAIVLGSMLENGDYLKILAIEISKKLPRRKATKKNISKILKMVTINIGLLAEIYKPNSSNHRMNEYESRGYNDTY